MATTTTIRISGLGKAKLMILRAQAEELGLSAERYARQLVEQGISLEKQARTMTFDELFAPVQAQFRESGMTEEDLDDLVDNARSKHNRRSSKIKG